MSIAARIHPHWVGADGYLYSVIYDGRLLVERSRDPECDAARALVARGVTGKLTLLDGKTGKPRTIIDIEKAAKLTVREDRRKGPLFVGWAAYPGKGAGRSAVRRRAPKQKCAMGSMRLLGVQAMQRAVALGM